MVESFIGSFESSDSHPIDSSQSNPDTSSDSHPIESSKNPATSQSSFVIRSRNSSNRSDSSSENSPIEAGTLPEEAGVKNKNLVFIGIAILIGAAVIMKVLRRVL